MAGEGEGRRREGGEKGERAEKDDFAEYARELREKYGELEEGERREPRHKEEKEEGARTPERWEWLDDDKREADDEEQSGFDDFKSYAKYLREKYPDFALEQGEEKGERKEDEGDDFASYAAQLRRKYGFEENDERRDDDDETTKDEALQKCGPEAQERDTPKEPGNPPEPAGNDWWNDGFETDRHRLDDLEAESNREIAPERRAEWDEAFQARLGVPEASPERVKTEETPSTGQDRARGRPDGGAYQEKTDDKGLEQQGAASDEKRDTPRPTEKPDISGDEGASHVGAKTDFSEARRDASFSLARVEEHVKETKIVEGRDEIPQSHEGAKAAEANSRPERGVVVVAGGAEPRQVAVEENVSTNPKLDAEVGVVEPEGTRKGEPAEGQLGVLSATALRLSGDNRTSFEVRVDSFERETAVTFERGKIYEIAGSIGEVCDFRKKYSLGESRRMYFFASAEYAESIRPGESYDVHVRSVREISRNEEQLGVFSATAYKVPGREDSIRFDILAQSFQHRTGVTFERNKIYEIAGEIGDVCEFRTVHREHDTPHIMVFAPREYGRDFVPGEKYDLTIRSVREKVEYHVTDARGHPRLTVQKRALEAAGLGLDGAGEGEKVVAELNLKGTEGASHRLFANVEPSVASVVMSMERIGAKVGDVLELQSAREYSEGGFVEDFNKHRSRELSNVRLQFEGKKMSMFVDDKRFEVGDYSLETYRTQAVLKCKVEPFQKEIRLWFDGKEATAKFGDSWKIRSFSASERGLGITYNMGRREITTHQDLRYFREKWLEMSEIQEKVWPLDEVKEVEGKHRFQMDESLYAYLSERNMQSKDGNENIYFQVKGDDGEDVGAAVFSKLGWGNEVVRHPFDSEPGRGSNKHGTDSLFRNRATGELFLAEFRWWKDADAAMKSAFEEVKERESDEKFHDTWGTISGAYIAIVDFNMRSRTGELDVKRVW